MTIGQRIKEARKNAGLTQRELAEKSGSATGTIQQYELGKRQPRIEQLQAIASALGVTTAYFLTGEIAEKHPLNWTRSLDKKLNLIGCSLESDELILGAFSDEDNKKWIRLPDCLLMLSDNELKDLDDETDSYLRFKLQELREKHKDRIKPPYWPLSSPPAPDAIGQEQTEVDTAGQRSAEMVNVEKQKKPTPVTEDGQDELEEFVRRRKADLTAGQQQKIFEMMQAMITPQKSLLSASAQEKVDGTSPKTEDLGQS